MHYRHIVFFKIHADVSEENFQQAMELLTALGENQEGLLSWIVKESLDTRKGRIIVEDATFTNEEAWIHFKTSDAHIKAGEFMREISDWIVGDYLG